MTLRSRIVDGAFNLLEFFAATYDLARKLQRRIRRDTDPVFTLTPERRTETGPIPKAPRVPKI